MPCALFRISALALVLLLLSGCGGSSGGSGSGSGGGGGGSTSTMVTITISGATPTAVATQIGSGQFNAATLSSGQATLSLPSGTTSFAVAYVCPPTVEGSDTYTYQQIDEATTSDGTSFTWFCPVGVTAGQTGSLAVSVDASAVPDASFLGIDAYNGQDFASLYSNAPTVSATLAAPVGTDQVYILAYNTSAEYIPNALVAAKLFTGQGVPGSLNGGSTVVLGSADEATMEPITFSGLSAGQGAPDSTVSYFPSGNGNGINLGLSLGTQYPALPATVTQSGGTYVLLAGVTANSANGYTAVGIDATFSNGGPQSFSFPTPWSYTAPTPAALPTLDTNYTGFADSASASQSGVIVWLPTTTTQDYYSVTATQSYQNGSTSITFPNLSSIPGFLSPPPSGTTLSWTASVGEGNIGNYIGGYLPNSTAQGVSNGGAYTVP